MAMVRKFDQINHAVDFLVILVHSLNPTKLCKVCCSGCSLVNANQVHILVAWISMWYLCCEKKQLQILISVQTILQLAKWVRRKSSFRD